MNLNNKKVTVILPAYNAAQTLERTVDDIPREWIDEIILVDDASTDETVKIAQKLGLKVFVHSQNKGYGGNQKTCYKEALKLGTHIVIMVHPDHQYDPSFVPELLEPLLKEEAEAVFGSRMLIPRGALKGGMPQWKYWGNIFLTKIANLILNLNLSEYHSGFRAYSRKYLKSIPFESNSDDFVFDTEIIIQGTINNFKIREIPITTHYFKEASMIGFRDCLIYAFNFLKVLIKYKLHQWRVKRFKLYEIK